MQNIGRVDIAWVIRRILPLPIFHKMLKSKGNLHLEGGGGGGGGGGGAL